MGATGIYTHYSSVRKCILNHLVDDFDSELGGANYQLLDYSISNNNVWMLYQIKDRNIIAIMLVQCSKRDNEFIYKCTEDNMGPYQLDCPKRFLDRATSTNQTALEWYRKCREFAARARDVKNIVKHLQQHTNPTRVQVTDRFNRTMDFERILSASQYIAHRHGQRYKYAIKDLMLEEWRKIADANPLPVN